MEELILAQLAQKEIMNRFFENYKKDGADRRSESYYKKRLSSYQELWKEATENHRALLIKKLAKPSSVKGLPYFDDDVYSQMEIDFINNYAAIEERFEKEFPTVHPSTNHLNASTTLQTLQTCEESIRLPKISMEKFYGDYSKWPTFHDLFKTLVHDNKSLAAVQKLQYLKLHLGGEAENLLKHFQVTESNYDAAWELLNDRYDNKRVLVNTHLKTLLSQTMVTNESAQGIKNLLDTTTECLQALENLEIDIKNWDVLIVYLTVQKLPSETHQLWEQSLAKQKDLPSWSDLQDFLKCRFRTLEALPLRNKSVSYKEYRNDALKSRKPQQTFHVTGRTICCLCAGPHSIRQCPEFSSLNPSRRLEVVKGKGLCLNCLGFGHMLANCPSHQRCSHCKQRHHSLLHRSNSGTQGASHSDQMSREQNRTNASTTLSNQAQIQSALSVSASPFTPTPTNTVTDTLNSFLINKAIQRKEILLATALVRVVTPSGRQQILRALIDQGSQASFVTEASSQALRLPRESIRAEVSGVGQTVAGQVNARVHMVIKPLTNDAVAVKVIGLVLPRLTHLLPSQRIQTKDWEHLLGLELADPSFFEPGKIDLLLGADIYAKILQPGLVKGKEGSPVAQKTSLGWILSGDVTNPACTTGTVNNFHVMADLDNQLKKFWELEDLKVPRVLTTEEQICEEIFVNTYRRSEDGRYEVALPFNNSKFQTESNGDVCLGRSRSIALSRLYQMESRFKRDSNIQSKYESYLNEFITLGYMKELTQNDTVSIESQPEATLHSHAYLPHHAVLKEDSTTTKLRVVFDASRKTSNGISLNDVLLKGPTIQDDLTCLLLRWRKYRIAFTADIEKMYLQIRMKPEHANYQRIVWRHSSNVPVKDYMLLTVTFGTKSAPYLATRVLQQVALDEKDKHPIGAQAVLNEFYVDDLLSGADTIELATEKQNQLIQILQSGGFKLRKWASNCSALLENVSEELREIKVPLNVDEGEQVKALGMFWKPSNDSLCYSLILDSQSRKWTKRTILSDVAKLFDPLGWAAPTIIIAKILLQRLWLAKVDWDEQIPSTLEAEWTNFREELTELNSVKLPRWIHFSESNSSIELHAFCDASNMAYAAVVYLCITQPDGTRKTALISAKTKVAPVKTVSLPRLELCGAMLLAKLLSYVSDSLKLPHCTKYAWTDSEIVLAWLRGHPSKWKTFIANRVSHIHDLIEHTVWRHVPSKENPADCATRGLLPSSLKRHSIWWNGPSWLELPKPSWPKQKDIADTNLEIRKTPVRCMQVIADRIEENFSSLKRLLRVTAYCYRFKSKEKGDLKSSELETAIIIWIKEAQLEHFSEEIASLQKKQPLKPNTRLLRLTPFIHSDGLLRVGGRLRFAELNFDEKHPIILPDKCHLSKLIIDQTHKDTLHGGPQLIMRVLAKRYWILNVRNTIRLHIHKCISCHKQRAETQIQLMGDLPRPRVTMSRPFSHAGVDYCGPFDVLRYRGRGSKTYKCYVAVFICMAIKAIHLECVTDLSAQCSDVYCDCGTNFIGGDAILRKNKQQMIDQLNIDIGTHLEREGVKFHFIPPGSPHFGGLWESGVKSTKFHMKRILGNATLTYEELSTTLAQIEACLNSRPLYPTSNDPNDMTALTPAHFLIGDILLTPPEPSLLDITIHRLDRWQHVQRLYQSFWQRWNTEYLSRLQQRPKWMQKHKNVEIGDLVILKEERLPPSRWILGRIIDTHPGADELVRVVTVKTKDSIMKRPVAKICLLPIENVENTRSKT